MKETFRSAILPLCILAFALSAAVTEDVGLSKSAIEMGYGVDIFECDNDLQLLELDDRQTKIHGRTVRICFQPNDVAMEAGVTIKRIDSWVWETVHDGGIAKQVAATDGEGDGILSELKCNNEGNICVLDTLLTSDFFKNKGSVSGLGEATLSDGIGRVPISKDIFQVNFHFQFTHGISGEEMTEDEKQEVMRMLQEQDAAAANDDL